MTIQPKQPADPTTDTAGETDRHYGFVRSAGRECMRNPPAAWDVVDEESDASFPASDPPAHGQRH